MILLIDDDNEINYAFHRVCKNVGLKSIESRSYQFAVEYLIKEEVELILCDMSFGMNHYGGLSLLDLVKEQGIDTPVIIVSGNRDPRLVQLSLDHGAAEFMEKPITGEKLLDYYDRHVKNKPRNRNQRN